MPLTVETVKVAEVAPAGTVTFAGGFTLPAAPALKVTSHPPVGAGEVRTTVPVELLPDWTVLGLIETLAMLFPITVRVAD